MLAPEKSPSVVDFLSRMDCCVAVVASVELPEAVMLALAVERLNAMDISRWCVFDADLYASKLLRFLCPLNWAT